jgi:hypothetical protein
MNEKSLEPKDLKCVAKAVYRRRRKTYPPLHTSQQETHENLQKMNIETNKFENFLQVNDAENGIFMDGTLGVVPSFLNNIHGYKDGNYIPLVLYSCQENPRKSIILVFLHSSNFVLRRICSFSLVLFT